MPESVNTRELAVDILMEVTENGQYSSRVLRDVLDKYGWMPRRDRAFVARLTRGTLAHLIEMDWILDQFSKTKVKKMRPFIRNLLRVSVYQMKYMDSVPVSAACNEAVKLAAKRGFSGLRGFVNGVLRNIARNLETIPYPDREKKPLKYLSVTYSVPEWILGMWLEAYGYEKTEEICAAFEQPSPLTVRTNQLLVSPDELKKRLESEGVEVRENPVLPYAFSLSGYDRIDRLQSFADGLFYVQDANSMLAVECAGIGPGDTVLDVCAAPGGKSLQAAEKTDPGGTVEARDLSAEKVELIEENIRRCRAGNVRAVQHDALERDESWAGRADAVIADLPCSGLGVIGRKPEIRYRLKPEDISRIAGLQREILSVVQEYVKPGGTLLYGTCTVSTAENEENAAWFAEAYPDFHMVSCEQLLPGSGGDGFFIAKFVRKK